MRSGYGIFYPTLDADAAATRERYSPANLGERSPGSVFNLFTLSASVSYALDLFGGQRRLVEGLRAGVDVALSHGSAELFPDSFADLIVANIVARTIIELAAIVVERLKPNGLFIASGIVEDYHDAVLAAFNEVGLTVEETKREDIWICLVARNSGGAVDAGAYARVAQSLLSTVGNEWA